MGLTRRQALLGAGTVGLQLAFPSAAHSKTILRPRKYVKAHKVIDAQTGITLLSENADIPLHPASITKLFLANAAYRLEARGDLKLTDQMKSDLSASMIASRNPHARRLAETIMKTPLFRARARDAGVVAGTQWAFGSVLMKDIADELGLTNTQIWNTSGLPGYDTNTPHNVSTADDIVEVAKDTVINHSQILEITSQPKWGSRNNTNRLLPNSLRTDALKTEGVDGLKTGFIKFSRYNLVFTAIRDGRRIVGVTTGNLTDGARSEKAVSLINDAFEELKKYNFGTPAIDSSLQGEPVNPSPDFDRP